MSLPTVQGWLIDYRTARNIFASQNNRQIDHCFDACGQGRLICCHHERELFKSVPNLKTAFIDQGCVYTPDSEVNEMCVRLVSVPLTKKLLRGDNAPIFVTAIAAAKNFGVITDHRNLVYTTAYDLCRQIGVPVYSVSEYFDLL